jgi:hypothetical protein
MKQLVWSPWWRLVAGLALGLLLALPAAMPAAAQYSGSAYSGYPYPPSKGYGGYGYWGYGSPCYRYAGIGYGPYDPYRTPCTPYGYTVTGSSLSYPYFGGYGYGYPYWYPYQYPYQYPYYGGY